MSVPTCPEEYCRSYEPPFPGTGLSGPYQLQAGSVSGRNPQEIIDNTTLARDALLTAVGTQDRALTNIAKDIHTFLRTSSAGKSVGMLTKCEKLEYSSLLAAIERAPYPRSNRTDISLNAAFEKTIIPRMILLEGPHARTYLLHFQIVGPTEATYAENMFSLRHILGTAIEHTLEQNYPLNRLQQYSISSIPFWHPTVGDLWSYDRAELGLYSAIHARSTQEAIKTTRTVMRLFRQYTNAENGIPADTILGLRWLNVAAAVTRADVNSSADQLRQLQQNIQDEMAVNTQENGMRPAA